jgi:hypothetical protein
MVWTFRKKILIGYGITLAVAMVVLLWAFVNLLRLGRASDAILAVEAIKLGAVDFVQKPSRPRRSGSWFHRFWTEKK